jgi:hypothetical protein
LSVQLLIGRILLPQENHAVQADPFSPRDAISQPGKGTLLCYGVVNAKSARIEPASALARTYPALLSRNDPGILI